jgi:hypothetical protein
MEPFETVLNRIKYPGRGIMIGVTPDKRSAEIVYFLSGRSQNSRNRILVSDEDVIHTEPFDPEKMEDPSLIIYDPIRTYGDYTIVSNGDQTSTIYSGLREGRSFEQSLSLRSFEPDAPIYTPRISALLNTLSGNVKLKMSSIHVIAGNPFFSAHDIYDYPEIPPGCGYFLRTYIDDGSPLQAYTDPPVKVSVSSSDLYLSSDIFWESLNKENRISLFIRMIDLQSGTKKDRIINRYPEL